MAERFYRIANFSGGISDSVKYGTEGSLAEIVGCNIHDEPGFISPSQALTKVSGGTVADFCKLGLKCSTGSIYFFSSTGTIYERQTNGDWSRKIYQDSYGTIVGCGELDDYIYWASGGTLSRISTGTSWATGVEHDWSSLTNSAHHQMVVNGLYLFIINGRDMACVDDTGTIVLNGTPDETFNTLPSNYRYTTITNYGDDLLLGTEEIAGIEGARILRWDTVSPTWNSTDPIPESTINAFILLDNYMLAQAGNRGRLYFYNGSTLEPFKVIQGDYANKSMAVYPGAVCNFQGRAMFGVSNLSGDPCNEGVYSLGQYDRNYPVALTLEYVASTGSIESMGIGAMVAAGTLMCVAWEKAGTFGIDEVDYGNKYGSAYFKTLAISGDRWKKKEFKQFNLAYKSKPSGTNISLGYYTNYGSTLNSLSLNDQPDYNNMNNLSSWEAGVNQFRVDFTASGNDAPILEELYCRWNEKDI